MIGQVYTRFVPFFKMYASYCSDHKEAVNLLEKLSKGRSAVRKALDYCNKNAACNGQTLQSLLIQPIQRVPRHKLLLKELLKHTTKTHPDYKFCADAQCCIGCGHARE